MPDDHVFLITSPNYSAGPLIRTGPLSRTVTICHGLDFELRLVRPGAWAINARTCCKLVFLLLHCTWVFLCTLVNLPCVECLKSVEVMIDGLIEAIRTFGIETSSPQQEGLDAASRISCTRMALLSSPPLKTLELRLGGF